MFPESWQVTSVCSQTQDKAGGQQLQDLPFPRRRKRRGEPVNESRLALGSEHPPFLLVEAHVGIQSHAEQSDDGGGQRLEEERRKELGRLTTSALSSGPVTLMVRDKTFWEGLGVVELGE